MMVQRRIDTHTHVVPPTYGDWLRSQTSYRGPVPHWSREAALESFAQKGIDTGVLSVSNPGIRLGPDGDMNVSRTMARTVNEFSGDVVRSDPRRFGFFASLVLPDVNASIDEATYAFDDLHADGVVLLSNTDGVYLGAPQWDPLLEFLNDRRAVVFVHPAFLPAQPVPEIPPGAIDFLADTTRAAVNLVKHDCLTRFPDVRVVLAHGGGYVPYAAMRIASMIAADADQTAVLSQLRRFWFDTALTGGPYALPSLLAFADPERLTFGSDWPYEFRPAQSTQFTERLDAFPMAEAQRRAINRDNAESLFPRLATTRQAATG